ncbi:hypothetical protein MLD38_026329 [Melastoma candidum]|uniref:Uncharacterized protein n=1 Tax=Melastoma candidum TaxID=119954 RepID=A0ACB9NZU4_9MYRT|nr:hypothetical protein MLD38_026329 [Melastoma candidum]
MESHRESSAAGERGEEELGEEEKMEMFFQLIRGIRETRIRMAMLQGAQGGESEVTTARPSKRTKADGRSGLGGGGRPWVPKFEAEDFSVDGTGCSPACSIQGTSEKSGEKWEDDHRGGLNLKLTL